MKRPMWKIFCDESATFYRFFGAWAEANFDQILLASRSLSLILLSTFFSSTLLCLYDNLLRFWFSLISWNSGDAIDKREEFAKLDSANLKLRVDANWNVMLKDNWIKPRLIFLFFGTLRIAHPFKSIISTFRGQRLCVTTSMSSLFNDLVLIHFQQHSYTSLHHSHLDIAIHLKLN